MATTWHQDVRNRNREEFILAGQHTLIENNFTNVALKEICERANLSKVTFYKCFNSLDELIFAVQQKILGEITAYIETHAASRSSGLESVGGYLDAWIDFLDSQPDYLKYIGFFDHTYRDHYPNEELQATYREQVSDGAVGRLLYNYMEQGVRDGSIRPDLDLNESSLYIIEMIISLMQRLAFRGKLLQEEHGVNVREIAKTSKAFVLHYLQK
ncbi:TetR/AcrR family transcriptional regulator [Paenibacillus sp. NFR01]|uniref:TetR/AcrR family transcriptional regulator n=1 Tax=Paenibacillus sp. NFR01 TaxID=1566279 RepID=UPI0008BA180C|nr:TetR family transcriptional regulator [Paenibacillus sp. NFR01]SET22232.1 transcriptional regulator, TetR family [Paenibacillus sp. NFR01]